MPCKTDEDPRPARTAVLQQAMDLTINRKIKHERQSSGSSSVIDFTTNVRTRALLQLNIGVT